MSEALDEVLERDARMLRRTASELSRQHAVELGVINRLLLIADEVARAAPQVRTLLASSEAVSSQ